MIVCASDQSSFTNPLSSSDTKLSALQPCPRIRDKSVCPLQHPCPKACGDECGSCMVNVGSIKLSCGHDSKDTRCHEAVHPHKIRCYTNVKVTMPTCGHVCTVGCWRSQDLVKDPTQCNVKCALPLKCGHLCQKTCGSLGSKNDGKDPQVKEGAGCEKHGVCTAICDKSLPCGHTCKMKCHPGSECDPCKDKCLAKCEHTQCQSSCSEVCNPCVEACQWECKHVGRCQAPCGAPCTRIPCNERCEKMLLCGHRCPSICGEACPEPKQVSRTYDIHTNRKGASATFLLMESICKTHTLFVSS